jgi:hypothetical protein
MHNHKSLHIRLKQVKATAYAKPRRNGGLDWAFAPHWSTNLEYNYYAFGDNIFTLTDTVNRVDLQRQLEG